jgi:universal stress protein A
MKIKPIDKAGGVIVELGAREPSLPLQETGTVAESPPVFRLKKILVPLDFSSCSNKALQYAIPFARQFGAELVLAHVIQPYLPLSEVAPLEAESAAYARENLAALQKAVGDAVPSRILLRWGDPHREIIDVAKEFGIDLIILSTHGHTGLEHLLLGSTTEKVVRHAGCPVLIVREHEHEFV